jgi:iron complex outermembrane receptor protein
MGEARRALAPTGLGFAAALSAVACFGMSAAHAQSVEDLQGLSISELANLEVSSATKTSQSLSDAPAALYVITHDDIVRSGATSLPQILRLAPNLYVAQTGASRWVITARGFSGNTRAESFSNKLLVLIDGRSVYDPLFSGVDWSNLDVVPEDIDRIEVISGPGATLWGANAVNGVINIITRASYRTQGAYVDVTGGSDGSSATVRYGGRISDDLTYRIYAQDFSIGDTLTRTGADADDHWYKPQGGFRIDWTPGASDAVDVEGDGYVGQTDEPAGAPDANFNGFDLNAAWRHTWHDGSQLQVQAYVNREQTGPSPTGVPFAYTTYDLEAQDNFAWGARQSLVVGGGVRDTLFQVSDTPSFFNRTGALPLSDVFAQDTVAITKMLDLIVGLKLETDPFAGVSALPSVRLAWRADPRLLFWGSVQKAIRSPTPFDTDPSEFAGHFLFVSGNQDFQNEQLTSYEVGVRAEPWSAVSFSAQVFYNDYDDLRSLQLSPVTDFPLQWGNGLQGRSYGLEGWGDLQATSWWRLSAGLDLLNTRFSFKPGASTLLGVQQAGDDPPVQASLHSAMNLGSRVTLDTQFRYVGALPNPQVAAYAEMDASLFWRLTPRLQLGLAGFNLLHDHHIEFAGAAATEVPRTGQIELRARF